MAFLAARREDEWVGLAAGFLVFDDVVVLECAGTLLVRASSSMASNCKAVMKLSVARGEATGTNGTRDTFGL